MLEKKKFYLTKKGLAKLKKEYNLLKKIRLAKTKEEIPVILESEDLNPEYLSFREKIESIETRLAELEEILKNSEIIKPPPPKKRNVVDLGATVITEVEGEKDEFTIVGTIEANPSLGFISNESPVGKALLGHKVGDVVVVSSPIKTVYKIKKIKYSSC